MADFAKEFDSVRRVFDSTIHGELLGESFFVHRLWAYALLGFGSRPDIQSGIVWYHHFLLFFVYMKTNNNNINNHCGFDVFTGLVNGRVRLYERIRGVVSAAGAPLESECWNHCDFPRALPFPAKKINMILTVCPQTVCLSACLPVTMALPVCLPACRSVCLPVCLSFRGLHIAHDFRTFRLIAPGI